MTTKKRYFDSWKGPTQGLQHTVSAEKMYSINFTEKKQKVLLILHYNYTNSYLFTEIINFKSKNTEILAYPLCLGNISKDWLVDDMKKNRFNGYIYDFRVDYEILWLMIFRRS